MGKELCICPQTRPGVCNNIQLWDMCKKNEYVDVYVLPVYFSTLYTALKMVQKTSLSCISKKHILMLTFFSCRHFRQRPGAMAVLRLVLLFVFGVVFKTQAKEVGKCGFFFLAKSSGKICEGCWYCKSFCHIKAR